MPLTDTFVKQVKPLKPTGDKYADGDGMYLLVKPAGKYWRMDYRYLGKRKTLALGVYPEVPLAKARKRREAARELLADGIEPGQAKQCAGHCPYFGTSAIDHYTRGGSQHQYRAELWFPPCATACGCLPAQCPRQWQAAWAKCLLGRGAHHAELEVVAAADIGHAQAGLSAPTRVRKNFLFAGADSGGERAAAMYALIGTAKLNGMDPEAYLRHVLGRIAEHLINRINDRLPWNVAGDLPSFIAHA